MVAERSGLVKEISRIGPFFPALPEWKEDME